MKRYGRLIHLSARYKRICEARRIKAMARPIRGVQGVHPFYYSRGPTMKSPDIKSILFRWASLLALALLTSCGGSTDMSVPLVFSASLTGVEETPPNASPGRGIGILTFDPNDRSFHARVVSSGVADNAAHIHEGAPGVAGPIVIPLTREPGSVVWEAKGILTQAQEDTLRSGNLNYYFNVHSPTFPGGEVRGQIERRALSPEQQQRAEQLLQELIVQLRLQLQPSTATPGTGSGQ
jgi:hypothetical protein